MVGAVAGRSILRVVPFALALSVAPIGACGGGEPAGEPAGSVARIDTVDGVVRVRNAAAPERWSLEPVVEVGEEGGIGEPGPEEFGSVMSVVIDPDGRLLVADGTAHEIRVFDADGTFVEAWGRDGEGPGEFRVLQSMGWLGDTLAVLDPDLGRITLLDRTGGAVGQRPYPGGVSGVRSLIRFYPVGPATLWVFSVTAGESGIERGWTKHEASGESGRLPWPDLPTPAPTSVNCDLPGGVIRFYPIPFGPDNLETPLPGHRVAVAWSADYRIAYVDSAGDTLRLIERFHEPVVVTREEWERETAPYREFREEASGVKCSPEMPGKPDAKPAIAHLYHDRAGRLWVEAITADGRRFDVHDGEGRLLAEIAAPDYDERVPPYLGEDDAAFAFRDSLGVQRVRAYRIDRSP